MLTKRELTVLKKALPADGYQKVADKLISISKDSVRKTLNEPKRYNKEIITTALAVIEEYKQELSEIKSQIKEIAS